MNNKLLKTALGVGLLASGLSAAVQADVSFGSSMIFAKSTGTPYYAVFAPSGTATTDSIILLELGVTGSQLTWGFSLQNGTMTTDVAAPAAAAALNKWGQRGLVVSAPTAYAAGAPAGNVISYFDAANNSYAANQSAADSRFRTFLAPGVLINAQTLAAPFINSSAVGTGTGAVNCVVSFNAVIDSAESMVYSVTDARLPNWKTASATAAGTAYFTSAPSGANSTFAVSGASFNSYTRGMFSLPSASFTGAYAAVSYTDAGNAYSRAIARSDATQLNVCAGVGAAREALSLGAAGLGGVQSHILVKVW